MKIANERAMWKLLERHFKEMVKWYTDLTDSYSWTLDGIVFDNSDDCICPILDNLKRLGVITTSVYDSAKARMWKNRPPQITSRNLPWWETDDAIKDAEHRAEFCKMMARLSAPKKKPTSFVFRPGETYSEAFVWKALIAHFSDRAKFEKKGIELLRRAEESEESKDWGKYDIYIDSLDGIWDKKFGSCSPIHQYDECICPILDDLSYSNFITPDVRKKMRERMVANIPSHVTNESGRWWNTDDAVQNAKDRAAFCKKMLKLTEKKSAPPVPKPPKQPRPPKPVRTIWAVYNKTTGKLMQSFETRQLARDHVALIRDTVDTVILRYTLTDS